MLSLAASLVLGFMGNPQQLPKQDLAIWETAKTSVAVILKNGVPVSQAALIDKSGLFLANQSAISTPSVQARLSNGKTVILNWKSTDIPTQTVLLQAEEWSPEDGTVVTLHAPGDAHEKLSVIVVLPSGPIRGDMIVGNRVAVLSSSRRVFQLGEVRFEANTQSVAGALVFDEKGSLLGLLNATLEGQNWVRIKGPNNVPPPGVFGAQKSGGGVGTPQGFRQLSDQMGPAEATTGYTVGPEILRRVVSGFLSPSHKVQHPAIGIMCKDGITPGALIVTVRAGSPAEEAGIQVGDNIVRMDDQPVRTQIDFSRLIETKDVGDTLTVVVMRDLVAHTFKVKVGTIQKAQVVSGGVAVG
jgi:hypothetical protein